MIWHFVISRKAHSVTSETAIWFNSQTNKKFGIPRINNLPVILSLYGKQIAANFNLFWSQRAASKGAASPGAASQGGDQGAASEGAAFPICD